MRRSSDSERRRRGFTLVELILAGAIAALVLITVVTTLSQVGRARTISRMRLLSHLRADAALDAVRRDLTSTLRDADLFHTRVLLLDGGTTLMIDGDRIAIPFRSQMDRFAAQPMILQNCSRGFGILKKSVHRRP